MKFYHDSKKIIYCFMINCSPSLTDLLRKSAKSSENKKLGKSIWRQRTNDTNLHKTSTCGGTFSLELLLLDDDDDINNNDDDDDDDDDNDEWSLSSS